MEEMRTRLAKAVAEKLPAGPDSPARREMIEELTDNLYHRYQDLTGAGMDPEEAFQLAMEDLGDVEELVEYLKSLRPDESLPEPTPSPGQEEGGQLEELLKNVEEIVKVALGRAKNTLKDAKESAEDSLRATADGVARDAKEKMGHAFQKARDTLRQVGDEWFREDAPAEVHPDECNDDHGENHEEETCDGRSEADSREEQQSARSWQFTAGYNRDKGGFYAQWDGPGKDADGPGLPVSPKEPVTGQALTGLDVQVSGDVTIRLTEPEDGDVVIGGDVEQLEAFRSEDGLLTIRQNSQTASSAFFFRRGLSAADVRLSLPRRYWDALRVSTNSGDVSLEGDVSLGQVTIQTGSGDVDGHLSHCAQLTLRSSSGDAQWEGNADQALAETTSGELSFRGRLSQVGSLQCKSVSGDIEWEGTAQTIKLQTVSGDIQLQGTARRLQINTVSGDVTADGGAWDIVRCSSVSGDVELSSAQLPRDMELSTKSGDCQVRLPDDMPFALTFKTACGSFRSDFFSGEMGGRTSTFTYRGQDGQSETERAPHYQVNCVSGDLRLYKG